MTTRIAVVREAPEHACQRLPEAAQADLLLDVSTERANVAADISAALGPTPEDLPPLALDLAEIAVAIYISDIAVLRGQREEWTRSVSLLLPVREVEFWEGAAADLRGMLYALTRDNFHLSFYARPGDSTPRAAPSAAPGEPPDCVCMLSGGLDSLAGAATLQSAGRRPIYSTHRSGNPTVYAAQKQVLEAIEQRWPGSSVSAPCRVAPHTGSISLPFVTPEEREPSRRARSLLFMTMAMVTAVAYGLAEVYMFENGVLSAALPMTAARAGSMSTRSTHPTLLGMFNALCERAGLAPRITNPFIYQTKSDLLRDVLRPALSPTQIQGTVSCWSTGRTQRQCGGCIPCLLRQIAMFHAGLPEEAYMVNVLAEPDKYIGTDTYGNLVDLLRNAREMLRGSETEILLARPELLGMEAAGVSAAEMIRMFHRHAEQLSSVLDAHFPRAARLML